VNRYILEWSKSNRIHEDPSMITSLVITVVVVLTGVMTTAVAFSICKGTHDEKHIVPWSRIAQVNEGGSIICKECCEVVVTHNDSRDLTSPREWMEYLEATEGEGGAYTVLRCDFQKNKHWRIWGRDFHLKRLCQSYCSLQESEEQLQKATETTNVILDTLLEQASLVLNKATADSTGDTYVVMMTILWQKGTLASPIVVRGHSFCSGKPFVAKESILDPVTAILALPFHDTKDLPNRYEHYPEAKLSSWCRRRRLLEQKFKVKGAGEVLLTRKVGDDVYILEGLTSNVFFVYPNKTLRTANVGVLKGYARKLVLDCASKLGLQYDPTPIRIQDASVWKEVFLTSSIRLMVPVKQIFIPNEAGQFENLWSADESAFPTSKLLYELLLKDE